MFRKLSPRRRKLLTNQLTFAAVVLGIMVLLSLPTHLAINVLLVIPPLVIGLILHMTRATLPPNAADGGSWQSVKIRAIDTDPSKSRVLYFNTDRIFFSDQAEYADVKVKRGRAVKTRRVILYRRDDSSWWLRNTGDTDIRTPHLNVAKGTEAPIAPNSTFTFMSSQEHHEQSFEFLGVSANELPPYTGTVPLTFKHTADFWRAATAHQWSSLAWTLSTVFITAILLLLTDSGMRYSEHSVKALSEHVANWGAYWLAHALNIALLMSIFVGSDALAVVLNQHGHAWRRPKHALMPLLAILFMAGTVIGFRTEGRILGNTQINAILNSSEIQNDLQQELDVVKAKNPDTQTIHITQFIRTPLTELPAPYATLMSNLLSDYGLRGTPGDLSTHLRYWNMLLAGALGVLIGAVWLVNRHFELLATIHTLWRRLMQPIDIMRANNMFITLIFTMLPAIVTWTAAALIKGCDLAGLVTRINGTEQMYACAGVPISEPLRLLFFVVFVWSIGRWMYRAEVIEPRRARTSTLHNIPLQQSWLTRPITYILVFLAAIAGIVLVMGITRDVGPYISSVILFVLLLALYRITDSHESWWHRLKRLSLFTLISFVVAVTIALFIAPLGLVAQIGVLVIFGLLIYAIAGGSFGMLAVWLIIILGFIGINTYRTALATTDFTLIGKPLIAAPSALQTWGIRPDDEWVRKHVEQQLVKQVTDGIVTNADIEQWYTSQHPTERCEDFLPQTFVLCTTDQSMRQALYAIIAGGYLGMGPGLGLAVPADAITINKPYVPNAHNDFVLVVILEEYGLIGGISVMLMYALLSMSLLTASMRIQSQRGRVLAAGLGIWWSLQVLLNLAGVIRIFPLAGIALPLMSNSKVTLVVTFVMLLATIVVHMLPWRSVEQVPRRANTSFRVLEGFFILAYVAMFFGITLVIRGVWLHQSFLTDWNDALQATPSTVQYQELRRANRMWKRIDCLYYQKPIAADIRDRGQRVLAYYENKMYGCESKTLRIEQAESYGSGTSELLQHLISTTPYEQRLYAPEQANIILTIDGQLQRTVDQAFITGTGADKHPISGQAIVMDYDGRVLAMINHYQRNEDGTIMPGGTNAPLDYHFQPGSTWKMLMSYAALKHDMPSDATIRCTQGQLIRGFAIPMVNSIGEQNCITASGSVDGATTLAQAMAYSINTVYTGMTDASIDQDGLPAGLPLTRATTLDALGDLGVTKHPQAAPWASWSLPASSAAIAGFDDASGFDDPDHPAWGLSSIGQGSAIASPLAMAAALQVIANDGQAKTVRIIDDATNSEWHDTVRMSPELARQVQALLFAAVDLGYRTPIQGSTRAYHLAGDAAIFDNERLLVGGKTGTAEIEDPANPLCAVDQASCPPISWFVGFAPDVERIVVVMYRAHTEPAPCSAANIAAEIFTSMLNHTPALPCPAFTTATAP